MERLKHLPFEGLGVGKVQAMRTYGAGQLLVSRGNWETDALLDDGTAIQQFGRGMLMLDFRRNGAGMKSDQPIDVVLAFLDRINAGDVPGMCELMCEDHLFVDALGNQVKGRETMRKGWSGYYKLFPDYKVSHEEIFAQGNVVAAFG